MKKSYAIILLFLTTVSFGQNYGHIWQFGNRAGIDFKNCDPQPILTGENTGFEGVSSISDDQGQLQFYTNSDTVWNKLNLAMPNGYLISTSGTLSQVLIIPKPQSNSQYYIVTTKIQASGSLTLQYHVVDMSLNSGLGDVISKNNTLTNYNVTEQIAATHHSNGSDIWLIAHEYGLNNFLAFLVTPSGISLTPVLSTVGPAHIPCTSNINARGEIKVSPNGNKIAFNANGVGGNNPSNILAIFDFDKLSGVISNPINLPFSRGEFGISFSPDNSKLYGSTWKAFSFSSGDYNYIYQFDLSSNDSNLIVNSKVILDSIHISMASFGSVKIGPDGKIYIARYNSDYLAVINSPNVYGPGCDYVYNGFYLGGRTCQYGLNNYIEYTSYCETTEIESVENSTVGIYPNPTSDELHIPRSSNSEHFHELQIMDVCGKVVYEKMYTEVIHVNSLERGTYILRLKSANKIRFAKFLKY